MHLKQIDVPTCLLSKRENIFHNTLMLFAYLLLLNTFLLLFDVTYFSLFLDILSI